MAKPPSPETELRVLRSKVRSLIKAVEVANAKAERAEHDALEKACRAVCVFCADPHYLFDEDNESERGKWMPAVNGIHKALYRNFKHLRQECRAAAIRRLIEPGKVVERG